ncbi:flagellar motor switch protein FliN [Fulvimarina sp. 2208YS6-2-32]|uniref:Flagellar motor switch protein FliN n=2 Tax=Fulvimarina uroteuthidis TaxID=3098149 RepID=A0ABU5I1R1_9HYPH|nr:flagellar motor switch protein FliN [Fulvimarina sp. 2208YS6-2-32]MDY8108918.1 flagellar motor switch protein FliN [Fulvimarina sp. 2208YS6-2-32]
MIDPNDPLGGDLEQTETYAAYDGDGVDDGANETDFRGADKMDLDLVLDVSVTMQVVLGAARMSVAELLKLNRGSIVKLDTKVGDPIDVVVNGRVIARGEIVVLDQDDQRFGVTLTEIATPNSKLNAKKAKAA